MLANYQPSCWDHTAENFFSFKTKYGPLTLSFKMSQKCAHHPALEIGAIKPPLKSAKSSAAPRCSQVVPIKV